MKIEIIRNMNNPYPTIHFMVTATEEFTYHAIGEMSQAVGRKIAAEIFKKNKKKIMAGVKLDLVIAEVEKNLLEKVKEHQEKTKKSK